MFAPASTGVRQPSPAIEHSGPFRCGCSHRRAFDLSSCTPRAHREFWLLAMSLLAQLQVRQLEALIEITFFSLPQSTSTCIRYNPWLHLSGSDHVTIAHAKLLLTGQSR